MAQHGDSQPRPKPQIPLILAAVFLIYLAQNTLNPIIAPLARDVGLKEWQVGVTISASALMLVLTSQFWGRRSQSLGRKPVLVGAYAVATLTMVAFAWVAWGGMAGTLTATAAFIGFITLRGFAFGAAMAAVPPTAMAFTADVTPDPDQRVKGMSGVGAVQGIAMVAGALVGGLLASFGLITPLIAIPILLGIGLLLLIFRLRREPASELVKAPKKVSPFDSRVWPFLIAGFGMFTALGFINMITGFIVQDRFGFSSEMTGLVTGAALVTAGIGLVLAQAVIVPRSGWRPPTLLRIGSVIAFVGFFLVIFELPLWMLFIAIGLNGLGLGIAIPGYTSGPTLLMDRDEQGSMVGLIGATNGLTFVIAPAAGTTLYGLWPPLPLIIGASIMALVAVFVWTFPRLRARAN